jgi:hypothetical protein
MNLDDLHPNEHNPRTIQAAAMARLKTSIQRDPQFMTLRPIVHDQDGMILGGNMRYRACKELGMTEIPDAWAICAADLTEEQRRRFILVDNAPEGMAGEWDWELLADQWEVAELEGLGFDFPEMTLPDPAPQKEPSLESDVLVEIRCSRDALASMTKVLDEWAKRPDVTVDIS